MEIFATREYAEALIAGATLSSERKQAVAEKLFDYTGLPVEYWLRSDLRVTSDQFRQELLVDQGLTTGRLDTRFVGPSMDPLSEEAGYDPQGPDISAAYVAAFNDYLGKTLDFGKDRNYFANIPNWQRWWRHWDWTHEPPGARYAVIGMVNVMPDLAAAMKENPTLEVLVAGGYFDVATPFFRGMYEMHHLPIPDSLQKNIEYCYYPSGHEIYVHVPSLMRLHDDVAAFIRRTDNLAQP